jgi:hypothetical protein
VMRTSGAREDFFLTTDFTEDTDGRWTARLR